MARFVYRLQKVYEIRERRKKEQEQVVLKAQQAVQEALASVQEVEVIVTQLLQAMQTAHYSELANYDAFVHKQQKVLQMRRKRLNHLEQALDKEKQELQRRQQELEALEKHKEKAREEWQEEEKAAEMKMLDEIASQRYFRQQQANLEELEPWELEEEGLTEYAS
jgi:flagellar protein FliJ